MAAAVDERTRLVIVCNPNNPTGVYRGADEVERFLDALPEDLAVLVDEAYYDFVDRPDAGRTMSLARERPNLLVTRTFSKAHGLCGLRVGYGVGGAGWVDALDRVRQPFNTNALAQAAALESLRHPAALERRVRETIGERVRVQEALAATSWAFTPSQANFILVEPDRSGSRTRRASTSSSCASASSCATARRSGAPGASGSRSGRRRRTALSCRRGRELARPARRETQPERTRP